MNSAVIRRNLEDAHSLGFIRPDAIRPETVPTGIRAIDRLTGGLPQGRITEVSGPNSSGRTTLMLASIAQITAKEEFCGLVDAAGTFDPASAEASGVDLNRLLWIRTGPNVDQTLKALDLLLQGGGFGLVAVDLGETPPAQIRRVPHSSWFRLQRVVENTPTALLFISQEHTIKTCASLALTLKPERVEWSDGLLHGIGPRAEIIRSRTNPIAGGASRSGAFTLGSADCLRAVPNSGVSSLNTQARSEGVSCHES
jgi:recombination protein RecA